MAGAGPPRPAEQPVRLDSIMAGIAPSAKVASRYSIGEKLGKGSFATVRAKTDCVMLEMLRNVLDVMQKNKTFPHKAYARRHAADASS